jgi:Uma2 family endonuclease
MKSELPVFQINAPPKSSDGSLPTQNLPTMYDLPSEDPEEPGLPDEFHDLQPELLRLTFRPPEYYPNRVFCGSDMNLYYDANNPLWHKRPDWFGVVGVSRLYEQRDLRLSYVIWQEKISPSAIVELLSPGTEKEDLGATARDRNEPPTKWEVYEQILQVPYYVVFNRSNNELQAFHLVAGKYQELKLKEPRIAMPELGLSLGVWRGEYQGINRLWLRWYDGKGDLILTDAEAAIQLADREKNRANTAEHRAETAEQQAQSEKSRAEIAEQQAQSEKARAETAEQRAEYLAQRLRELGIEP